jgi:sec-independent protein translocase protein TatA
MFQQLGWGELLVLALIIVLLFGWKRLPDMARSLGRSARVFKSEVNEMKQDGKPQPSDASQSTVHGDVVDPVQTPDQASAPTADPTRDQTAPRHDGPAL